MAFEVRVNGVPVQAPRGWMNIDDDSHIRQIQQLARVATMVCEQVLSSAHTDAESAELAAKLESLLVEIQSHAEWMLAFAGIEHHPEFQKHWLSDTAARSGPER